MSDRPPSNANRERVGSLLDAPATGAPGRPETAKARVPRATWTGGLLIAALLATPATSVAQVLLGRVVDETTLAPIPGVVVSLFRADGERLRGVLSNSSGLFNFTDVGPGTYRLRAEMIGRERLDSEPFEVVDEPPFQTLHLPVRPIDLTGVDVTTSGRCEVGREIAQATYLVWEEVRKALTAASITENEGQYEFTVEHFHRDLHPSSGAVLRESSNERLWLASDPFTSLAPEEIERAGYVRERAGGTVIYGPNTDLFLSDGFLRTHCLALTRSADLPGLVGLTFRPVPDRELPDITGVLWVDEQTAELRSLQFSFQNLPERLVEGDYTGLAEYMRLSSGGWIIYHWRLRSPTLEEEAMVTRIQRVGPT